MKTIQEMREKYWQPGDVFCPKVKSPERLEVRITEPMVLINRQHFYVAQFYSKVAIFKGSKTYWETAMRRLKHSYEISNEWWNQF